MVDLNETDTQIERARVMRILKAAAEDNKCPSGYSADGINLTLSLIYQIMEKVLSGQ